MRRGEAGVKKQGSRERREGREGGRVEFSIVCSPIGPE